MSEAMERYIEVGMTALRDPKTGKYGKPVPLYIRATEQADAAEQQMIDGIGNALADIMRRYVNGCRKAGVAI